ncbi:MAG: DUF4139 domain-containing protein [Bacteroidota bacterium]|nr:DUF4139 domain-containing protein [Bacteroidota bacterium]
MLKFLLSVFLTGQALAAAGQTQLPLHEVTLYTDGAELHHRGTVSLPAGPAAVHLSGLAPGLVVASLLADATGAELEDVEMVAQAPPPAGSIPVTTFDSLRVARATLRRLHTEEVSTKAEKDFFWQNRLLPPVAASIWLTEMPKAAAAYGVRLGELTQREEDVAERLRAQTELVSRLAYRAGLGPNGTNGGGRQEVVLHLLVPKAGVVQLRVGYQVSSNAAFWTPQYELRVSDNNRRQLRVVSRAYVLNQTGLPWTKIPVTLRSTAPVGDMERPSLDPWTVAFGRAGNEGEGRLDAFAVKGTGTAGKSGPAAPDTLDVGTRLLLSAPLTLATGASRTVKLAETVVPMRLEYLAVPKREEDVFLVGRVGDWNQVGFLSETAKVFYRGAYMGDTDLDTRAYSDTLEVALGRDPQVQLTRTKREDFAGPINGGSREKTRLRYEINVKNSHNYPVRLRLIDQLPVSQEKEITIKAITISGASLDESSGKLTWLFTLPAGASRRFGVSFQVEAPASKATNLRRDRSVRSPKFR